MKASPLMDEPGFTRAFEQALRSMWLKFVSVLAVVAGLAALAASAGAQTTQPAWTQTKDGEMILRPFEHAPYPHPSREQGFKGSKQFFPKAGHYDDSTVAVFIPRGYVPGERVNFIVHFHGHMTRLSRVLEIHRLPDQVTASGVNAILIVPQGPKEAADSGCGKLELDPGAFAKLLEEVCIFLKQEGKITSTQIGRVVLSAHSGGYKVTAAVLDHGGMADHITDVLLLDASYGSLEWFAAWCGGASDRRLVSLYTEHLADENKTLMGMLDKTKVDYDRLDEIAIGSEVIKRRKPLFIPTTLAHNDVPMKKDYLKRLLETSALASGH